MLRHLVVAAFLTAFTCVQAQDTASVSKIQDNSFLIEEAYNQEPGVVQHIFNFTRLFESKDWVATFTQEWPVLSQRHQFSYTIVGTSVGGQPNGGAGFGDLALNYRLQAVGSGETRLAVSPRVSLLIPNGDERLGRGYGGTGVQLNLPVSFELFPNLVAHWNAGTTLVPNARSVSGDKAFVSDFNIGQGLIWLAHRNFNVMLETLWNAGESVVGPERTERFDDVLVSPGVRWAHNFRGGLQIVPGVAVPIGVGPSAGEKGILFYVSFEHSFRRTAE